MNRDRAVHLPTTDISTIKTVFQWTIATLTAFWHGLPAATQLLFWLMVIDFALGVIVAVRTRNLSAGIAWAGVTKKLVALLLVGVAALLNPHVQGLMEINLVQAASVFYIIPELTSIARNAAILEVPVFAEYKDILRYFSDRGANKEEVKRDE
jgi:toxin secretion/phage lysis holin